MKRIFLAVLSLFACIVGFAEERIVVVDAGDRGPVVGASVMTRSGVIVGITDMEGAIRSLKRSDYPVEIRSLGYEPQTISETTDTVSLVPALYPLSEVTVNPDRPITRVLCYARVFTTFTVGSDTIKMYSPQMLESFYAQGKVKGFKKTSSPNPKALKYYFQYTNNEGLDSVARAGKDNPFLMFSLIGSVGIGPMPYEEAKEPQSMRDGEKIVQFIDKHGREFIYRKNDGTFSLSKDCLKNRKNHTYSPNFMKLLGGTVDFHELNSQHAFRVNDSGKYEAEDLLFGNFGCDVTFRGKWFKMSVPTKEPIKMRTYTEIYPVEFTYHTVGEYKELKKDKSKVDFKLPENIQPLPPAIAAIVDRIESAEKQKAENK